MFVRCLLGNMCRDSVTTKRIASLTSQKMSFGDVPAKIQPVPQNAKVTGVVAAIRTLNDSSKLIKVKVEDEAFNFHAGQWVDFFAPGVQKSGGLSICSTPNQLKQDRTLELMVKRSNFPPVVWIHNDAREGDQVEVRVGGTAFATKDILASPILLIAGGMGIAPMYSILRNALEQSRSSVTITLLYMARGEEHHLMRKELEELSQFASKQGGRVRCIFYDTTAPSEVSPSKQVPMEEDEETPRRRGPSWGCGLVCFRPPRSISPSPSCCIDGKGSSVLDVVSLKGRITDNCLREEIRLLEMAKGGVAHAFICGPPKMTDDIESQLFVVGMPKSNIHLERWW